MINSQTKLISTRRQAGFSMIDVLVAIVVLATGLLALAALQGAMTRNSADARARSQIAAYSEGLIDQLRSAGYSTVGASGGTAQTASKATCTITATSTTTCPTVITTFVITNSGASTVQTAAGVSGLTTKITSQNYNGSGTTFTAGAPVATSTGLYKQVNVTSTWTDATGQSRTLSLDTIVDSTQLNQTDQSSITKSLGTGSVSGPIVRQYNPGATAGVIPIAIGSSNTAATNPQPEILGKSGSSVSGVTYNVLTYTAPDSDNESVIQQNVDTRVIACSCKNGAGVTNTSSVFAQAYRPTYWDGTKYTSPSATALGYSTTGVDSSATQDSYCSVCCRDRNDPAASGDDQTLFDPFTTDYNHYRYVGTTLTVVPTSDTTDAYLNNCRLIRVDGQYRTAVDLQNYFFGLLATTTTATSPIPDPTAVTNYQSFVTNYLTGSITTLAAGSGPSSTASAATQYAAAGLDSPTNIGLTGSTDKRYLNARGLYIDYLEPVTLTAINSAISTCPSTSTTASCVLPLLPFTTINETELANWTASVSGVIQVTDTASLTSDDPTAPLRGVTTEASGAVNGATANAVATIGVSNSGVIGNIAAWAVDPDDLANTLTDSQQFTIGGGSSGGGTTLYFNVALSFPTSPAAYNWITNLSSGNVPSVFWNGTAKQLGTAVGTQNTAAYTASTTSPYQWYWYSSCTTTTTGSGKNKVTTTTCAPNSVTPTSPITAPVGMNFIVENYNLYTDTLGADSSAVATDGSGNTCPVATGALECFNFPVTSASVNGTAVSITPAAYPTGTTDLTGQNAETLITIPSTPGISSTNTASPDVITIGFGSPTLTVQTGTCVATVTGHGKNQTTTYVYAPATSCPL